MGDTYSSTQMLEDVACVRRYLQSWIATANEHHCNSKEADKFVPLTDEVKIAARRLARSAITHGSESYARTLLRVQTGEAFALSEDEYSWHYVSAEGVDGALEDADLRALRLEAEESAGVVDTFESSDGIIEVWPDLSDGDGVSTEANPMRFDRSHWRFVASKLTVQHNMFGDLATSCTESLYTDSNYSTWILLIETYYEEASARGDTRFRIVELEQLRAWIVGASVSDAGPLNALLEECTLSPSKARSLGAPLRPKWQDGVLWVGGVRVASLQPRAKNLRPILEAFEEEGWPERVDDPLPGGSVDPGGRLRDAIKGLNSKQEAITFSADGSGEGICWKLRGSSEEVSDADTPPLVP